MRTLIAVLAVLVVVGCTPPRLPVVVAGQPVQPWPTEESKGQGSILFSYPIRQGVTVTLREKYGPTLAIDSVNVLAVVDGAFRVTRNGKSVGVYPTANYSATWGVK